MGGRDKGVDVPYTWAAEKRYLNMKRGHLKKTARRSFRVYLTGRGDLRKRYIGRNRRPKALRQLTKKCHAGAKRIAESKASKERHILLAAGAGLKSVEDRDILVG